MTSDFLFLLPEIFYLDTRKSVHIRSPVFCKNSCMCSYTQLESVWLFFLSLHNGSSRWSHISRHTVAPCSVLWLHYIPCWAHVVISNPLLVHDTAAVRNHMCTWFHPHSRVSGDNQRNSSWQDLAC